MTEVVVPRESRVYAVLSQLAREKRVVFFAGLPGTGKSLMIHQLANVAHGCGRTIHLLQWDVARPVFESTESGRRYPQVDGVTQEVIRVAAGRWARDAIRQWHDDHSAPQHLLIGETPFVGHRFVELARAAADAAEPVLSATSTCFVIPVPSREVRRHLEAKRERRSRRPLHNREKEDAPPQVLRGLWQQLVLAGQALGVTGQDGEDIVADVLAEDGRTEDERAAYDPVLYQRTYMRVLHRRHTVILRLDDILPTDSFSAYDFAVPHTDLLPTDGEASRWITDVESAYPDPAAVRTVTDQWYVSP